MKDRVRTRISLLVIGLAACGGNASTSATAGAGARGGSGAADAGVSGNDSNISGTLGALGPVQPIVAGWATTNGLETLIYLSSAPLTCEMMMTQGVRWLSKLPTGSQVIEIVVGQPSSAKTYKIGTQSALGGGEVNYAEGSKSSSTEVQGSAGTITLTKAGAMSVQEGMIDVTSPFKISGAFHAEWCQGATEF